MKRQNSITLSDFTNFLQAGALLRYKSEWILTFGDLRTVQTHKSEEISVFCPPFFDVDESLAVQFSTEARLSQGDFIKICRQYLETVEKTHLWDSLQWHEPDMADFSKAFAQVKQLIGQEQIEKAVPCVFAKAPGTVNATTLCQTLLKLSEAPPALHVYGFWRDGEGMIGATPEILFEKRGPFLTTMALAGTLAKASDARGEQLLKDRKERHENQIVVEDLRQQLSPLGATRIYETGILDLPSLWHLITQVEVQLTEDQSVISLVKRLHPTAALGVAPRRFGWRWMREWPQQTLRQRFGAPFLMRIEQNHWLCLVAIRNLQWSKKTLLIGSGCGLVKESELEREWLELFYKRESIKKILGIKT